MRVVHFFGFLHHLHLFFFFLKKHCAVAADFSSNLWTPDFSCAKTAKNLLHMRHFPKLFFFFSFPLYFSEFFFGCYLNFELTITNDTRVLSENSLSLMSWSVFFNHSVFVDNRETFWCVCDPGNFLNSLSLWLLKVGLVGLWQELLSWFVDKPLKWVRGTRIWPT